MKCPFSMLFLVEGFLSSSKRANKLISRLRLKLIHRSRTLLKASILPIKLLRKARIDSPPFPHNFFHDIIHVTQLLRTGSECATRDKMSSVSGLEGNGSQDCFFLTLPCCRRCPFSGATHCLRSWGLGIGLDSGNSQPERAREGCVRVALHTDDVWMQRLLNQHLFGESNSIEKQQQQQQKKNYWRDMATNTEQNAKPPTLFKLPGNWPLNQSETWHSILIALPFRDQFLSLMLDARCSKV